jgi:WD40 repeat protein
MINLSGGATNPSNTKPIPTSSYKPPSEILNSQKAQLQQTFKLDLSEPQDKLELFKYLECKSKGTKYVQAKFSNLNKCLLVSREDGYLELINFNNNKLITECKFHDDVIMDFDIDSKNGIILTASIDGYACVINIDTFQVVNKFHPLNPTRNLNTCKIMNVENPNYDPKNSMGGKSDMFTEYNMMNYVCNLFNPNASQKTMEFVQLDIDSLFVSNTPTENKKNLIVNNKDKELSFSLISGGQDSKLVTTTNQKEGGFDTLTYNSISGEQISIFQDHFGPINTLAVNENAKLIASGAEDATIRIYKLDNFVLNHLKPERK